MKPVTFYVRNLFELAMVAIRARAAAADAIRLTGAAKITVEPAAPETVHVKQPKAPEMANWHAPIAARARR